MSEIWTAKEERNGLIIFEVRDEDTDETRTEQRRKDALPLMFTDGGYLPLVGEGMKLRPPPWRFRKIGERIYLDGPSIGVDEYHPIDDAPAESPTARRRLRQF